MGATLPEGLETLSLHEITMSGWQLPTLPRGLRVLELKDVHICRFDLTDLPPLLEKFKVRDSQLTVEGSFEHLHALSILEMPGASFASFSPLPPNLHRLDLSKTNLSDMDALVLPLTLYELSLCGNDMIGTLRCNPRLAILNVSSSAVPSFHSLQLNDGLQNLDIQQTRTL